MDLFETMRNRRSARAFKPALVPREIIENILELIINAPSANNLQPWGFIVVADEEKDRLSRKLIKAYKENQIRCISSSNSTVGEEVNHERYRTPPNTIKVISE